MFGVNEFWVRKDYCHKARICFDWVERAAGPSKVEILDYHWDDDYGTSCYPTGRTSA
jgi:hypothetical protein